MFIGKQKCKILKEIRQRIADENDIPYVTSECQHQGDCRGTCPKCEAELGELERQLAARQAMGKRVTVAALCASMAFSIAGCTPNDQEPQDQLTGEVDYTIEDQTTGSVPSTEELVELMGDVAYPEESDD